MPPKAKISKNKIIQTAFEMIRNGVNHEISARTLAKALNTSTTPIYHYIGSLSTLEEEIAKKGLELFYSYLLNEKTPSFVANTMVGYILFALNEPSLFKIMFMNNKLKSDKKEEIYKEKMETNSSKINNDPLLQYIPLDNRVTVFDHTRIYTHGYACNIIYLKSFKDGFYPKEEQIIKDILEFLSFFGRGKDSR